MCAHSGIYTATSPIVNTPAEREGEREREREGGREGEMGGGEDGGEDGRGVAKCRRPTNRRRDVS